MLIYCVCFLGCSQESAQISADRQTDIEQPDHESWPFNLVLSTDGVKTGTVKSNYMAHYKSKEAYELSDSVVIDFFDEFGNHTSRLTSANATVSQQNNIMYAFENVVVVSDSGVTLFTEELYWDNEQELVHTDEFVTFITETDSLFGHGFESDRSLNNYTILNPTGVAHRHTGEK